MMPSRRTWGLGLLLTAAVTLHGAVAAHAQDEGAAQDEGTAVADTFATVEADTVDLDSMSATDRAIYLAKTGRAEQINETAEPSGGPLFRSFKNKPVAGTRASVRQYSYYWEIVSDLKMRDSASFKNTLDWSWDEFRRQNKTVEKWNNEFIYSLGKMIPLQARLDGRWNWSEDKTVNTAGVANLNKRNNKKLGIELSKQMFRTGPLVNIAKASASINDQKSVNQGQRNDFNEGILDGGFQTAYEITPGLSLAGRLYGMATSGERTLGTTTDSSTADGDSLGFGVYYGATYGSGRAVVTRSNFNKNYLDFVRNSNALIDTVGLSDEEKVVFETETNDAMRVEIINDFSLGKIGFQSRLSRDTNDLDYAVSGVGLKQRQNDLMQLTMTFGAGRDSFAVGYDWKWKWDDQRIKGATANRGKQNTKDRDFEFQWFHRLFTATMFSMRYHQQLGQDIAENVWNDNDKDRLQSDFSMKAERNWYGSFRASMVYAYTQVQDISIRESRSANNNTKDSHEIAPSYTWTISRRVSFDQSYRLYIQYTGYDFGYLDTVDKDDSYNKRGNLATRVTLKPTKRLGLTIRHDYNKRFNAKKTGTSADGGSYYAQDLNQRISKIDLGMTFDIAPGATFEAATYRTNDKKYNPSATVISESINKSGEIWVGCRVKQTWGRKNPLELSAMVRKYNAFGPSVTETSADYWEADVWLKWSF
jgi:hypothetical protein